MNEAVLSCQNLKKAFKESQGHALTVFENLTLEVAQGEQIAIMGRSGSGKTTLLQLLAGLDDPTSGSVSFCGHSFKTLSESAREKLRNESLGFIYQLHYLLPEFTAFENIAMPLLIANHPKNFVHKRVFELLEKVGLRERANHKPAALSGGERQRIAIARALSNKPKCVLADEPTGNLDSYTAFEVFELLTEINRLEKTTFVIVTHDAHLAEKMDKIYILEDKGLRRKA